MSNTNRVDKALFEEDHYLGKPADDTDRIISRRIEILEQYPEFFGSQFNMIEVTARLSSLAEIAPWLLVLAAVFCQRGPEARDNR